MSKTVPLTLRLPEDLHTALVERAQLDARSLNGEMIFLLREALFPMVDADAYRNSRTRLHEIPTYSEPHLSRPTQ